MTNDRSKRTPGPWEYFQGAICFGKPDERMVLCTPHLHQGTPEADCILMAAAPELLEALEAVMYWASDAKIPCCFPRQMVLDAIAKAKSEKGTATK